MDVVVGSVVAEIRIGLVGGDTAEGQLVVTRVQHEADQTVVDCKIVVVIPTEKQ